MMSAELFFNLANKLDGRMRLITASIVGIIAFFIIPLYISWQTRIIASWDVAIFSFLLLAWVLIFNASHTETEESTVNQDQSGMVILSFTIIAAIISLLAIALMLHTSKNLAPMHLFLHIAVSIGAILLAWLMVHTMFVFHYAHKYYRHGLMHNEKRNKGLIFPSDKEPDYMDFVYCSFVIGMTSQVSDIQISSKPMRKLALIHGIISFGFNAMILALSINIVASLI
jgi:uncharacterized membrane protein